MPVLRDWPLASAAKIAIFHERAVGGDDGLSVGFAGNKVARATFMVFAAMVASLAGFFSAAPIGAISWELNVFNSRTRNCTYP